MNRAQIKPELLRWARERAGISVDPLERRFPKLKAWERGELHPTLKRVERFARATSTPVGFLCLDEQPVERVPVPDFRTIAQARKDRPSPDLLDTIYLCQQRQDWCRDFERSMRGTLDFVGSVRLGDDVVATAARIREALGFDVEERRHLSTWTDPDEDVGVEQVRHQNPTPRLWLSSRKVAIFLTPRRRNDSVNELLPSRVLTTRAPSRQGVQQREGGGRGRRHVWKGFW